MKNDQGAAQSTLPVIQADEKAARQAEIAQEFGWPAAGPHSLADAFARHRIEHSTPDRNAVLERLLREAREQLNDTSVLTGNLGWKTTLGDLVDRIDAALTTTPEPTDPAGLAALIKRLLDADIWVREDGDGTQHIDGAPIEAVAYLSAMRTPDPAGVSDPFEGTTFETRAERAEREAAGVAGLAKGLGPVEISHAFRAGWSACEGAHDPEAFAPYPPKTSTEALGLYLCSLADRNLVAPNAADPAGVSELADEIERRWHDWRDCMGGRLIADGMRTAFAEFMFGQTPAILAALRTPPVLEVAKEALTEARGVLRDYITGSGEMDDADRALLARIDAALKAIGAGQ